MIQMDSKRFKTILDQSVQVHRNLSNCVGIKFFQLRWNLSNCNGICPSVQLHWNLSNYVGILGSRPKNNNNFSTYRTAIAKLVAVKKQPKIFSVCLSVRTDISGTP